MFAHGNGTLLPPALHRSLSSYNDVKTFLSAHIDDPNPEASYDTLSTIQPRDLSAGDIGQHLVTVISISLIAYETQRFSHFLEFMKEHGNDINLAFSGEQFIRNYLNIKSGDAEAVVSYGCLEYQDLPERLLSMVKTPFSLAEAGCDQFSE